ncbi:peptidase E [Tamlana sedimentorum]|uniref:Peptidase E n=1 Tax=Neotamlana sedimentorum TaxID=1435349 RepID=A0A0D7WAW7_9FLAO|nr:DUF6702 family protein [Tamlana sedimentorum]KJD35813.1 peptidase E [Tamlana sedimentorum]
MRINKVLILLCVIPLFAFTGLHKYYLSVTQIDYVKTQESLQITTRIFVDDLEQALRRNFNDTITLTGLNQPEESDIYIKKYVKQKFTLNINNQPTNFSFIGKEYDGDIVRCYLEVENVKTIKTIEISNAILFDIYKEQQNIVKTKINGKQKSKVLSISNKSLVLNFN